MFLSNTMGDPERLVHAEIQSANEEIAPRKAENQIHGHSEVSFPVMSSCNESVVEKIERVFEGIADALLTEKKQMSVTLHTRHHHKITHENQTVRHKRIHFPSKMAKDAWRFAVVVRIMEIMHEALQKDVVVSKRDIYYRDPNLFRSQRHVDRYVDDIALTFGTSRSKLNVTAVVRGLTAGAITFCRKDGSTLCAASDREGILVPTLKEIVSVEMKNVKWILVVEKEATFRSINASSFWNIVRTEGVVITGKGYPDLATRALLRYISSRPAPEENMPPPIYGLVDFDPDGLAILSTYKHGSAALAHESAEQKVPHLKWLGLRSEHLRLAMSDMHAMQGLLKLTMRDRRKAMKLLEKELLSEHEGRLSSRAELQAMLMLGVKAELQVLDGYENGLVNLLMAELANL